MFAKTLKKLCRWTAERLMPSWKTGRRRKSDQSRPHLSEWNHVLGDVLARAAPFFNAQQVRRDFLNCFLVNDEEGLKVLAPFIHMTVICHVIDAAQIPKNTFELLGNAADRVIADPMFRPGGYRAGEVHGWEMPELVRALLFVNFDVTTSGSARFANGDWTHVSRVVPIVSRLVKATGWSHLCYADLHDVVNARGRAILWMPLPSKRAPCLMGLPTPRVVGREQCSRPASQEPCSALLMPTSP